MALLLCKWWLGPPTAGFNQNPAMLGRFSASIVAKNERGFLVLEADDVA